MKVLGSLSLVAAILCFAPAASAKFKLSLSVSDSSPRVGQPVRAILSSEVALKYNLKLIAVAPEKSWYDVVGVVTRRLRDREGEYPSRRLRYSRLPYSSEPLAGPSQVPAVRALAPTHPEWREGRVHDSAAGCTYGHRALAGRPATASTSLFLQDAR
jgi:hypothetical protein